MLATERNVAVAQARRELESSKSVQRRWMREFKNAQLSAFVERASSASKPKSCIKFVRHKAECDIFREALAFFVKA